MIYLQDRDVTILHADVLDGLRSLEPESVHCVVTSPPYWGLRDYGTGAWDGGDPNCDHIRTVTREQSQGGTRPQGWDGNFRNTAQPLPMAYADVCGKCGATRVDQQLGLEATPDLYVTRMVEVFREVRRVLRRDGTCWVNLGDSYASAFSCERRNVVGSGSPDSSVNRGNRLVGGLKEKDLVGIPWRVAFALQADGWYLRSDIIWAKPNPMPESVTDRPTKAHEYVFLLTRSPRYFFDQEAVREPTDDLLTKPRMFRNGDASATLRNDEGNLYEPRAGRNVRTVWDIATQPYPEAHFATYPEELVRRCVLAGTSERGCCPECGAPWVRVLADKPPIPEEAHSREQPSATVRNLGKSSRLTVPGAREHLVPPPPATLGWSASCACPKDVPTLSDSNPGSTVGVPWSHDKAGLAPVPCTVLDPFGGSGTTAHVARKHGRHSILIELNHEYCELAAKRLAQQSLLTELT